MNGNWSSKRNGARTTRKPQRSADPAQPAIRQKA
jgi:hypothetical protein